MMIRWFFAVFTWNNLFLVVIMFLLTSLFCIIELLTQNFFYIFLSDFRLLVKLKLHLILCDTQEISLAEMSYISFWGPIVKLGIPCAMIFLSELDNYLRIELLTTLVYSPSISALSLRFKKIFFKNEKEVEVFLISVIFFLYNTLLIVIGLLMESYILRESLDLRVEAEALKMLDEFLESQFCASTYAKIILVLVTLLCAVVVIFGKK